MKPKIYGVILSAGYSSRMSQFKPLAKYKGDYFIINILKKLSNFCDKIFIITGYQAELLEMKIMEALETADLLNKIEFVFNKDFPKGMFSSVQTAARRLTEIATPQDYIFLHLVDQPQISLTVYEALVKIVETHKSRIIIPSFSYRSGHPILFKSILLKKIINTKPTYTLEYILVNEFIHYVNVDDSAILKDVNTNKDLKRL
jgi:molybdenum cofactor cytidylyltransferase